MKVSVGIYGLLGPLDLNMRNMRSVIRKPPTMLEVAATIAMVPRMAARLDLCSPARMMAPTTAMASRALVRDISGVCSSGETRRITSKPMNAASMNTYKLDKRSSFTASRSLGRRRQGRQPKKFPYSGIYDFVVARHQRFAVNFICFVDLQLAVFHQVQQKRCNVASVHLAGMI